MRPAWIVHCAAATNVDWCESHPVECMRVNAEAAGALARAARSIGARLVYISTDSVFDGVSGGYRETDPVSPVNHYARSKASGESAVLDEIPDALVLRTNIYGWNLQSKHSLAEWALARLEGGEVVPGFRDVSFSPLLVNIWHCASGNCSPRDVPAFSMRARRNLAASISFCARPPTSFS
jgi:dTDP-4-dehydrorhamnose reductase